MNNDSELNDAKDLFQQLVNNNQVNTILSQKLTLLSISMVAHHQDIDYSYFTELNKQDCDQLTHLRVEAKKQMFVQIVSELAKRQKHSLYSSRTEIIHGCIDIKTKTLGRWKNKKFILNLLVKSFEIPRKNKKSKSKKPDRSIQLQFYSLSLMKFKDTRNRFCLQALQKGKGYYKQLVCGTSDLSNYTTIVENLKKVCFYKDEMMNSMVSENFQINHKPRQSEMPLNNPNPFGLVPQPTHHQRQSQSVMGGTQSLQVGEQEPINFMLTNSVVMPPKGRVSQPMAVKDSPPITPEKRLEQPNQSQSQSPLFFRDAPLEQIKEEAQESENQKNIHQEEYETSQPMITQIHSNEKPSHSEMVNNTQQIAQKNEAESPVEEPSPLKIRNQVKESSEVIEEEMKIQAVEKSQQPTLLAQEEEDQFEDAEEFNEMNERIPQLFHKLEEEGKLSDAYLDRDGDNFTLVFHEQNIEILRSISNPLLFRSTVSFENLDQERVFQAFAEIEFFKKWNGNLNSTASKFVCLIQSQRSAIIYEKRKQYGLFFLPRDYVYLRNVFEKTYTTNLGQSSRYYIIDKSILHDDCPNYLRVIRGEINYQIVRIERHKYNQTIKVLIETEITNGGFSSLEQDGYITLVYLQELKNLEQFLKTYQEQPLIQSPLLTSLQFQIMQKKRRLSFMQVPPKVNEDSTPIKTERQPSIVEQAVVQQEFIEEMKMQRELSVDEQIEQFEAIQRRLSFIPDTGTYRAQQVDDNQNEIKKFEQQEAEEAKLDQSDYVPTQVIYSTAQEISAEYRDKVMQQIKWVEQESYFSYCLNYKYVNEPVPVKKREYITEAEGGHFFLKKDWERDTKNGGLLFINPKKVDAQKRVIKFMLKKIGSNLVTGKSILSISLPVEIFETRSNLERFAYGFTYGPKYLEEGANMSSPQEQMKMSVTFGLTAINMYLSLEKPFNPILGETYQGVIDGCPVYVEQVSHHPPICAFQLYGRGYKMDGHIESVANMHANSVQGKNVGYLRMTYYNTKSVHTYMMVPGLFTGTAFGDRVFNLSGKGFCVDMENSLIWEGIFNPGKSSFFGKKDVPQDYFHGGIYHVKPSALQKFKKEGYSKFSGLDLNKDVVTKLNNTVGIWNEYLEIDGEQTWNLKMLPHVLSNHRNPLPSDSNYRLDILYWKLKDFDNSQRTKEILEIRQRNDKKLREKFGGRKH